MCSVSPPPTTNASPPTSEVIFDELCDELATALSPAQLTEGLQLLDMIEHCYGPAPLRPVW